MKRPLVSVFVLAVALSACAELFNEPTQCTTDADCSKFEAVCDVANGLCVADVDGRRDGGASTDGKVDNGRDSASDVTPGSTRCTGTKTPATVGTAVEGVMGRSEIAASTTLECDKDWTLESLVVVRPGVTLTIAAGTTIKAKKGARAGIVVLSGARIVAEGTAALPIVITSDTTPGSPDDWTGVFVLGKAPPTTGTVGGEAELAWGGNVADDDSGVLSFVRIEYAQQGLVLAGAGSKTKVDFVQVRRPATTCFNFYGGRLNAKHLVCQSPGVDQFGWFLGYAGKVQFLFGQGAAPPPALGSGGIFIDDAQPTIRNATLCGGRAEAKLNGVGVSFRDNATLDLNGAVVSGWRTGLDAIGLLPAPGRMNGSIVSGNATNPAFVENTSADPSRFDFDDDNGYDEISEFNNANPQNSTADPGLVDCFDPKAPKPWPAAALTRNASAPPDDGFFDTSAAFVGAFRTEADTWMTGAWARFDEQ